VATLPCVIVRDGVFRKRTQRALSSGHASTSVRYTELTGVTAFRTL
jgi:hypothetical protein